MANATNENSEFAVEDITAIRIRKNEKGLFVTEFNVKWVGYSEKNWEPMENVFKCPNLLKGLTKKYRQRMLAKLTTTQRQNEGITSGIGNFPAIPQSLSRHFNHDIESIPTGNETVMEIPYEHMRDGEFFWEVRFEKDPYIYYVRKCVMEYFFPEASAHFHLKRAAKEPLMAKVVAAHCR